MIITAFSFKKLFKPRDGDGRVKYDIVPCDELFSAGLDYQARELAFYWCVNLVANAMGRCEVRTYVNGREVKEREYYLWNVEPNVNQNSTAFWHKLVTRLFTDNEVLIFEPRRREGYGAVYVADDWEEPEEHPSRMREYRGVRAGDSFFDKTFFENDVLHLTLNHVNIQPVIAGLYNSYYRLCSAAMKSYEWGRGQHWKVHVEQVASGADGWTEAFQSMLEKQIKPFLDSNAAILPEFDGYKYENASGGGAAGDTRDIKALFDDIFEFTARAFNVPYALAGSTQDTKDAKLRFLSGVIDPICDQLEEEINRKRYGFEAWQSGSFVRVDSSAIEHFDLFNQAAAIEKLVGSAGYSINDIRRATGEAPIDEPWADRHFLTKNIGNVGAAEDA